MMKRNLLAFVVLGIIFCLGVVCAGMGTYADISIEPFQENTVHLNYSLYGEKDVNVSVFVSCKEEPVPSPEVISVALSSLGEFFYQWNNVLKLNEQTYPQHCVASVYDYDTKEVLATDDFFLVTEPTLDVQLITCRDADCELQTKVFHRGERVYFKFKPDITQNMVNSNFRVYNSRGVEVYSTQKTIEEISYSSQPKKKILPSLRNFVPVLSKVSFLGFRDEPSIPVFSPNEVGNYNIVVNSTVPGYKPILIKEKISVVE